MYSSRSLCLYVDKALLILVPAVVSAVPVAVLILVPAVSSAVPVAVLILVPTVVSDVPVAVLILVPAVVSAVPVSVLNLLVDVFKLLIDPVSACISALVTLVLTVVELIPNLSLICASVADSMPPNAAFAYGVYFSYVVNAV